MSRFLILATLALTTSAMATSEIKPKEGRIAKAIKKMAPKVKKVTRKAKDKFKNASEFSDQRPAKKQ